MALSPLHLARGDIGSFSPFIRFKRHVEGKLYIGGILPRLLKSSRVSTVANLLRARIKDLRLAIGLTQEQYAERCQIPYKVLQHLERGRRDNPRLSTLEKLAKGAGVSVFDLFAPKMPSVQEQKKKTLPPHNRKRVKKAN